MKWTANQTLRFTPMILHLQWQNYSLSPGDMCSLRKRQIDESRLISVENLIGDFNIRSNFNFYITHDTKNSQCK